MPASDLIFYKTGAVSAGAGEYAADRSMGGYRSEANVESFAHELAAPIRGVVIEHVSGLNGEGTGQLRATTADKLTWRAPGDTEGAAVTINNGESKALASGTADKFVRVRRVTADALAGRCDVKLTTQQHNVISGGPVDAGGVADYRAIIVHNDTGAAINAIKIWVDPAADLAFALDSVGADDYVRDNSILGPTVDPGFTWLNPTTEGAATTFSLAAGAKRAIWIRRTPDVTGNSTGIEQRFHVKHPDGAKIELFGKHTLGDPALALYQVYKGTGGPVDYVTPWTTSATLPITTPALTFPAVHKIVTRFRNKWGLESQNLVEFDIELDGAGAVIPAKPSAPVEQSADALPLNLIRVRALYDYDADGASAADEWLVYTKVGADPVPGTDTPAVAAMTKADGIAALDYTTPAFIAGQVVYCIATVRRQSDSAESTNTTASLATAVEEFLEPDPGCDGVASITDQDLFKIWTFDANNYIEVDRAREVLRIVIDGNVVGGMGRGRTLVAKSEWAETLFGANIVMASLIEFVAGAPNLIRFGIGNGTINRAAELDANGLWKVGTLEEMIDFPKRDFSGSLFYRFNATENATDFSLDLIRTGFRLDQYDQGGGVLAANAQARKFVEGDLL